MNKVIAGDWLKKSVSVTFGGKPFISSPPMQIMLDSSQVSGYEVVDSSSKVSTSSALNRALIGSFFFGAAGLAAGIGAKKKGTYYIAIQFKNGFNSLLEVDDKVYKAILKSLFNVKMGFSVPESNDTKQQNAEISIADEIKKYKELLDSGALTEEEFLELKQKLVGISTPLPEQENTAEPSEETKTIQITRKPKFIGCGADYQIFVDGTMTQKISNGETVSIQCALGKHTISLFNPGALNPKKPLGSVEITVNPSDEESEICVETKSLSSVSIKIVK